MGAVLKETKRQKKKKKGIQRSVPEDVSSIPGLIQWVRYMAFPQAAG